MTLLDQAAYYCSMYRSALAAPALVLVLVFLTPPQRTHPPARTGCSNSLQLLPCLLQGGPAFSIEVLVPRVVSMVAALHGAHLAGILINDNKTPNWLLTNPDSSCMLLADLDAATSKPTGGRCSVVGPDEADEITGTMQFMAPERAAKYECSAEGDW
jgi:hypothetical protein